MTTFPKILKESRVLRKSPGYKTVALKTRASQNDKPESVYYAKEFNISVKMFFIYLKCKTNLRLVIQ